MRIPRWVLFLLVVLSCIISMRTARAQAGAAVSSQDWPVWGGSPENQHYSSLTQINRSNVKQLQLAWTYDTGEKGGLQTSPLVVGRVLYGLSPTQKVFAVDATSGKLLWNFDSSIKGMQPDRGLAYWSNGEDKRILVGVMNLSVCAGRYDGEADSNVRYEWPRRSARESGTRTAVSIDFANESGDCLQRSDHRRRPQSGNVARTARRYPSLRCAHRKTALVVPYHSASR